MQKLPFTPNARSVPDTPHLHPHDLELLALLAQALVPERHTRTADPSFQHLVKPQPVPPIPTAYAQETVLTENQIVVDPAVWERFESYSVWCGGTASRR